MIKKEAPHIAVVTQLVCKHLHSSDFKIERVLSGVSTYVYRIELGEDILYLRILPEQDMSFAVEVHVHNLLRQRNVQVPEVIYFEHNHEALGMSVMIVKEILGSNIEDHPSIEQYDKILFHAGQQLAVINQISVEGYSWIVRSNNQHAIVLTGEKPLLQDYIYEHLEADLLLLSKNVLLKDVISLIRTILKTGRTLMLRHQSHLIHGDFDDSHIFAHQGKFTGIIDFGEIQGNSPLYDLGHFKLHDGQQGQKHRGYPSLTKGYNEVRQLSDDDQIEIDLWALWIGVRRLGMIYNRTWGSYHDHLIRAIKLQMDRLNNKL
ncbi:aminoglycoside phosphotransferase family protein [Paenibacillus endoradicis]|uniref:aminoglycoside phosphotransferase family protein n=1 Tax=Paenibacillus endoradicis TaxID=2972487 RepID=UPI002158C9DC|nr:aminoglycoside phosphotransferase family protein [Paenibacillus endoradicis]MCR8658622.1 aminoglycoside phosphotransferase family protein [Paenibacillus endoradicis]